MPIQNDFLPFAAGPGANVLTQAQYAALTSLIANGFSSGLAPSVQLNKVWRQSSVMTAVLAQFIVSNTGQTAIDDGTTATLLANLATAISVTARQNPVLTDTGAANAYVVANLAAFTAYPTASGLTLDVSIANANTGASTLNVDSLGAKPILGLGLQPLQGGELPAKGVACLLYVVAPTVNSGNGAWVVMECTGGAQQVAPGTQSNHATTLGQSLSSGAMTNMIASRAAGTTYTNSTGRPIFVAVSAAVVNANDALKLTVGGVAVVGSSAGTSGPACSVSAVVPNGATYVLSSANSGNAGVGTISTWAEVR